MCSKSKMRFSFIIPVVILVVIGIGFALGQGKGVLGRQEEEPLFAEFDNIDLEQGSDHNNGDGPANASRDPKLFPLFKLYTNFPVPSNTKCTHEGLDGHCLKKAQCRSINGGNVTSTTCAKGIGICCLINLRWEGDGEGRVQVKHSPSHIVSSGRANRAIYEVAKQRDVCQLRLDFKRFDLDGPLVNHAGFDSGTCSTDAFTVSGAQNLDRFALCGNASGQHVFLHFGESELIRLTMDIVRASSTYNIQVIMVKCNSPERAPDDCTQYFTSTRDTVRSFNFPNQHLNDHRYAVCVKSDMSSIDWSPCTGPDDPFFITGIMPDESMTICRTDHVTIPGSIGAPSSPIYCGGQFTKVKSNLKPYAMYVNFDGGEPELGEIGINGCAAGYNCVQNILTLPELVLCDLQSIPPYQCPSPCHCSNQLSAPGQQPQPPTLDIGNTGFCLQYSKA